MHLELLNFVVVNTTQEVDLLEQSLHLVLVVDSVQSLLIQILQVFVCLCCCAILFECHALYMAATVLALVNSLMSL